VSSYPDWVMRYKGKGCYVNRVDDGKYRLYRGHSERIAGTGKVRRVVDEYIGTITEAGLARTKGKTKGDIRVLTYGRTWLAVSLTRRFAGDGNDKGRADAYALGLLLSLFGRADSATYLGDAVSLLFPGVSAFTLSGEPERMARMIGGALRDALGAECQPALDAGSRIYLVHVNGRWEMSRPEGGDAEAGRKAGIDWEGGLRWIRKSGRG
jgi:hypothetical protein